MYMSDCILFTNEWFVEIRDNHLFKMSSDTDGEMIGYDFISYTQFEEFKGKHTLI